MQGHIVILNRSNISRYLEDGVSIFQDFYQKVHIVSSLGKISKEHRPLFASVSEIDMDDVKTLDDTIANIDKRFPLRYVSTISEFSVLDAARFRNIYKLIGTRRDTAEKFRDKVLMKKALTESNIRVPRFFKVSEVCENIDSLESLGDVIFKPIDGCGSENMYFARDISEVRNILDSLQRNNRSKDYEVEEFIKGTMFHCDSITVNGKVTFTSTSQFISNPGDFEKKGYFSSIMIDEQALMDKVQKFNQLVITALNLDSGVTHHELFIDEKGELCSLEIANRPAGALIPECILHTYGVNLIKAQIMSDVNGGYDVEISKNKLTGSIYFMKSSGMVVSIPCYDDFKDLPLIFADFQATSGQLINQSEHCVDYIACFLFESDTSADLQRIEQEIKRRFNQHYVLKTD